MQSQRITWEDAKFMGGVGLASLIGLYLLWPIVLLGVAAGGVWKLYQWRFRRLPAAAQKHPTPQPLRALLPAGQTATPATQTQRELAISRGGGVVTDPYAGQDTPLMWNCAKGHYWSMPARLVQTGAWCPQCSESPPPH